MYKAFKFGKIRIAFNKFPKTAKKVSSVYLTGLRKWSAFEDNNYSVVVGVFRVILSIDKPHCCGEI